MACFKDKAKKECAACYLRLAIDTQAGLEKIFMSLQAWQYFPPKWQIFLMYVFIFLLKITKFPRKKLPFLQVFSSSAHMGSVQKLLKTDRYLENCIILKLSNLTKMHKLAQNCAKFLKLPQSSPTLR